MPINIYDILHSATEEGKLALTEEVFDSELGMFQNQINAALQSASATFTIDVTAKTPEVWDEVYKTLLQIKDLYLKGARNIVVRVKEPLRGLDWYAYATYNEIPELDVYDVYLSIIAGGGKLESDLNYSIVVSAVNIHVDTTPYWWLTHVVELVPGALISGDRISGTGSTNIPNSVGVLKTAPKYFMFDASNKSYTQVAATLNELLSYESAFVLYKNSTGTYPVSSFKSTTFNGTTGSVEFYYSIDGNQWKVTIAIAALSVTWSETNLQSLFKTDVVDSLSSTVKNVPLSAYQGKVLGDRLGNFIAGSLVYRIVNVTGSVEEWNIIRPVLQSIKRAWTAQVRTILIEIEYKNSHKETQKTYFVVTDVTDAAVKIASIGEVVQAGLKSGMSDGQGLATYVAGSDLTLSLTATQGLLAIETLNLLTPAQVVNSLDSTSIDVPLSANQGKVLAGKISDIYKDFTTFEIDIVEKTQEKWTAEVLPKLNQIKALWDKGVRQILLDVVFTQNPTVSFVAPVADIIPIAGSTVVLVNAGLVAQTQGSNKSKIFDCSVLEFFIRDAMGYPNIKELDYLSSSDVVNNLTSVLTNAPLSAYQGKVLDTAVKAASSLANTKITKYLFDVNNDITTAVFDEWVQQITQSNSNSPVFVYYKGKVYPAAPVYDGTTASPLLRFQFINTDTSTYYKWVDFTKDGSKVTRLESVSNKILNDKDVINNLTSVNKTTEPLSAHQGYVLTQQISEYKTSNNTRVTAIETAATALTARVTTNETNIGDIQNVLYANYTTLAFTRTPTIFEQGVSTTVTLSWATRFNSQSVIPDSLSVKKGTTVLTSDKTKTTIQDMITATQAYSCTIVYKGVTKNASVSVNSYYPKYYGGSTNTALTSADVLALTKQPIASSAAGNISIPMQAGQYLWLCIPSTMNISTVKSGGFDVPMEAPVSVAVSGKITYKCYRSSSTFVAGTFTAVIA